VKKLYTSTWRKVILAVICITCIFAGMASSVVLLYHAFSGPAGLDEMSFYAEEAFTLASLQREETAGGALTSYEQAQLQLLRDEMEPANTNFRVEITLEDGTPVYSNLVEGETISTQYGWWTAETNWFSYDEETDNRYSAQRMLMSYSVVDPMTATDSIYAAVQRAEAVERMVPVCVVIVPAGFCVGVILLILLCRGAGHRAGQAAIVLRWWDRIPYDVYWLLTLLPTVVLLILAGALPWWSRSLGDSTAWIFMAAVLAVLSWLLVALVVTTAVRGKAKTIVRNTAIYAGFHALARLIMLLPMVWRAVLFFVLYLLAFFWLAVIILSVGEGALFLMVLYQLAVLVLLCRWALQWKQIRQATGEIVGGNAQCKIAADHFYPDLREHAGQLNAMGGAISAAVEQRMRSEHFKAELITNVSHDLKTPLTSIINYVDLLKKEEIENQAAQEYIAVLDRKSQRLKKLTEDLVEASKASTGAVAVQRERLDIKQLVRQAMGEYEEKLAAGGLTLVATLPEQNIFVQADGRHVWRVLDNLLGNCCKYALAGTRVYLDLSLGGGQVVCSIKNISAQPLNVPPEQLMERFVRGDAARTDGGSGLGLSIARSLTELQGGVFSLCIDGDLFKSTVCFPSDEG